MISISERKFISDVLIKMGLDTIPSKLSMVFSFILVLIKNNILIVDCELLGRLIPEYINYFMLKVKYKKLSKSLNVNYDESKFDDLINKRNYLTSLWEQIINKYVYQYAKLQLKEEDMDSDSDSESDEYNIGNPYDIKNYIDAETTNINNPYDIKNYINDNKKIK